jgi:hypothetical protein
MILCGPGRAIEVINLTKTTPNELITDVKQRPILYGRISDDTKNRNLLTYRT